MQLNKQDNCILDDCFLNQIPQSEVFYKAEKAWVLRRAIVVFRSTIFRTMPRLLENE